MVERITAREFQAARGVEDWRVVGDGACAFFRTGSLTASAAFVAAISNLPGISGQPPDLDIRAGGVTVRLITYTADYFGMSRHDLEIARQISAAAREQGATADPSAVQSVLVVPGALAVPAVMPFWEAVLGYEPRRDSPTEDLVDPNNRGPALWFEKMKEPRKDGGGAIHIAVWVPHDQARARVAAAIAAGGRMVRDEFAPAWWTLADAAGNEADISTIEHRD